MPRIARAVLAGYPHHVTQRGNYGQTVFDQEEDQRVYLEWLCEYKARHGLKVWAWCLMDNHVHLVAVPERQGSLGQTLHSAHMRYANYLNRKRGAVGHLWQGRFYSCVLDDEHLWAAIRYVERNPVRAGVVERAEEYRWSSARAHLSGRSDGVLDGRVEWNRAVTAVGDWSGWLGQPEEHGKLQRLRSHTRTGRPLGDDGFLAKVEALLDRRLKALTRGRPTKPR
jgi:putative transposase